MTDETQAPLFGAWLEETKKLQLEAYGAEPHKLEGEALRYYLTWNHTAAVLELGEMIEETRWKPWSNWQSGDVVIPDKGPYIKEAVDALHFVANLLVAGRVTTEELNAGYRAKMQVNRDRQAKEGGYVSQKGVDKCPACARSYEDAGKSDVFSRREGEGGVDGFLCRICKREAGL